jgi:hypothetical protein
VLEVRCEAFRVSPRRRTALRTLPRRDRCVNSTLTRLAGCRPGTAPPRGLETARIPRVFQATPAETPTRFHKAHGRARILRWEGRGSLPGSS